MSRKMLFNIPVVYQMWGMYHIEATSLEAAKKHVLEHEGLPSDPSYIDDSLEIDEDGIPIHNPHCKPTRKQ